MNKTIELDAIVVEQDSEYEGLWCNEGNNPIIDSDVECVIIQQGTSRIGHSCFLDCTKLKKVVIPDSVEEIAGSAFSGCESLEEIEIPDSVIEIGDCAFACCSNLKKVKMSSSVTVLPENIFMQCVKLEEITNLVKTEEIQYGAFEGCENLKDIIFPDSLKKIGNAAFRDCSSLFNVSIPQKVTYIGNQAFAGCESMVNIFLPNELEEISDGLFIDCKSLPLIGLPNVKRIGNAAFKRSALCSIDIPSTVLEIGDEAFSLRPYHSTVSLPVWFGTELERIGIDQEFDDIRFITAGENKINNASFVSNNITIDDIDLMSGAEFEDFLVQLFTRMGYGSYSTKTSGDQGIDVIAEKNGIRYGIQAKCYSGTVGNSAIQEAFAGKAFYNLDKVIVVTNNTFTKSAVDLAVKTDVILWDRTILVDKLHLLNT